MPEEGWNIVESKCSTIAIYFYRLYLFLQPPHMAESWTSSFSAPYLICNKQKPCYFVTPVFISQLDAKLFYVFNIKRQLQIFVAMFWFCLAPTHWSHFNPLRRHVVRYDVTSSIVCSWRGLLSPVAKLLPF